MVKKLLLLVLLAGAGLMFWLGVSDYQVKEELNPIASYYADQGLEETGAANLVTAVVVRYRGLDTLGEVTILFLTASILGFFLKLKLEDEKVPRKVRKASEILEKASKIITPVIFLFGIYVFINGHLTPGGGFQGGAIIASGL